MHMGIKKVSQVMLETFWWSSLTLSIMVVRKTWGRKRCFLRYGGKAPECIAIPGVLCYPPNALEIVMYSLRGLDYSEIKI